MLLTLDRDGADLPVAGRRRHPTERHAQDMRRHQLVYAAIDRQWIGHAGRMEKFGHGMMIDLPRAFRKFPQGTQLGTKQDGAVCKLRPIKGLYAKPVAYQPKPALAAVPERERENAVELRDRALHAPERNRFEEHLGVGIDRKS